MVRKYEKREVTHGNAWGAWAKIEVSELGAVTFGEPQVFTGLRATSFDTTQESNPYYADDQEHIRLQGAKSTEGSITVYQFPKQFMLDHLGKKQATNGMLLDTGSFSNFAFQYIETVTDEFGNDVEELHIWYNLKASVPTASSTTKEESSEPKEFEIPIVASPNNSVKDADGKSVTEAVIRKTKENEKIFDLAYTQIILPTTTIPAG